MASSSSHRMSFTSRFSRAAPFQLGGNLPSPAPAADFTVPCAICSACPSLPRSGRVHPAAETPRASFPARRQSPAGSRFGSPSVPHAPAGFAAVRRVKAARLPPATAVHAADACVSRPCSRESRHPVYPCGKRAPLKPILADRAPYLAARNVFALHPRPPFAFLLIFSRIHPQAQRIDSFKNRPKRICTTGSRRPRRAGAFSEKNSRLLLPCFRKFRRMRGPNRPRICAKFT